MGYTTVSEIIGHRHNGEPRLGHRLIKDEAVADRVALAWRMKLSKNTSLQEIHEATRLYSKREHYSDFFSNLLYAGILVYHGSRFPQNWESGERFCEPYVTLDEFMSVQTRREKRTFARVSPRRLASPYLLTGLLRCGVCAANGLDTPMNGHQSHPGYPFSRFYRCANKMHGRAVACAMPKTPTWLVDEAVCEDLLDRVLTVDYLSEALRAAQDELAATQAAGQEHIKMIESELKEQKERVQRLLNVIEQKGMNDLIEQQYDRANKRYLALTAQLTSLRIKQAHTQPRPLSETEVATYAADLRRTLLDGAIEQRQALLRQFIARVTLHLDRVTIEYTFR